MKHWSGPLSVALLSTPDTAAQLTTALHRIRAFSQGRVDLHVVGSTGVISENSEPNSNYSQYC